MVDVADDLRSGCPIVASSKAWRHQPVANTPNEELQEPRRTPRRDLRALGKFTKLRKQLSRFLAPIAERIRIPYSVKSHADLRLGA